MITDSNKIIAEFLGRCGKDKKYLYAFKGIEYNKKNWFNVEELRFHIDWNWLMLVVEKIENLDNRRFKIDIYEQMCSIIDTNKCEEIFCFNCDSKINVTYNACLEFIINFNILN